jgi:integrase
MGTIIARKRKDGSIGYTAYIRVKKKGMIVHTESVTFDREQAAKAWMKKRETELAQPGALEKPADPLLSDVIEKYSKDTQRSHGKTKDQVLRTIMKSSLGEMRCSEIGSQQIVEFAQAIKATPQTVGNYLAHLSAVFSVAKPAWGYPLSAQAMADARIVAARLGIVGRSKQRNRRPTLEELDKLFRYYAVAEEKRQDMIPMRKVILFAIFSTRRQEEITRIKWKDLDPQKSEIIVRDMKNPGEKIGNDVQTTLTPEALQLILAQPRTHDVIWPYNAESIGASFRRACKFLEIDDLHFHDLRHEGISRLFELGWNIPHVACVSGHRSWTSLKRYTHIQQTGDKYAGWSWIEQSRRGN